MQFATPWAIVDVPGFGAHAIVDAEGFTVVNPSPMGKDTARLLRAAPDMMEALRLAAKVNPYGSVENAAARDAAIAIIERVEGR